MCCISRSTDFDACQNNRHRRGGVPQDFAKFTIILDEFWHNKIGGANVNSAARRVPELRTNDLALRTLIEMFEIWFPNCLEHRYNPIQHGKRVGDKKGMLTVHALWPLTIRCNLRQLDIKCVTWSLVTCSPSSDEDLVSFRVCKYCRRRIAVAKTV